MKLYDKPKCLADLEKGDIVYTLINGEITQAKLVGFRKEYELKINEGLEMGDRSYYEFITPTGFQFKITRKDACSRTNEVFATYDDLRANGNFNNLQWNYGCLDCYGSGNKENQDARLRFINKVKEKYQIEFSGKYCFHVYFNSKRTKQVTELHFPELVEYDSTDDLYISHCGSEYGFLGEMLESGRFFRTEEECERAYRPKIVTFEEPKKKPEITHYAVYKRTYNEDNTQTDDELIDMFKTFYDAVAHAALYAYDNGDTLFVGENVYHYQYIVFPMYGDDDVDLSDILYHGELYNV